MTISRPKRRCLKFLIGVGLCLAPAPLLAAHDWSAPKPGAVKYYEPGAPQDFTLMLAKNSDGSIKGSMWMRLPRLASNEAAEAELPAKIENARAYLQDHIVIKDGSTRLDMVIDFPVLQSSRHESHDGYERVLLRLKTTPEQTLTLQVNDVKASVFLAELNLGQITFTTVSPESETPLFQ